MIVLVFRSEFSYMSAPKHYTLPSLLLLCLACCSTQYLSAQPLNGQITGRVINATTKLSLYGCVVTKDISRQTATSATDGIYTMALSEGVHTISYRCTGFQSKIVSNIPVNHKAATRLDIVLFPVQTSTARIKSDSVPSLDSVVAGAFKSEIAFTAFNTSARSQAFQELHAEDIEESSDQYAGQVLKRLSGINVTRSPVFPGLSSFMRNGLGNNYSQLLINGLPSNSLNPSERQYLLESIPARALEKILVYTIGNASIPAYTGGVAIDIRLKDIPVQNFFYLQATGMISDQVTGKTFFNEQNNLRNAFGFSAKKNILPDGFPTSRTRATLSQKNLQEQVNLSKLLPDQLIPSHAGPAAPGQRLLLGFGKIITFNNKVKMGITGFANQQSIQQINSVSVQVSPDVVNNPYPVNDREKPFIRYQSTDMRYIRTTGFSGMINTAILYGRNKITLNGSYSNHLISTYANRTQVYKPDEDSIARFAIGNAQIQRSQINAQLSGEHILNEDGKLTLNWQFRYGWAQTSNPNDRNFLLRKDSTGKDLYEIASSSVQPFVQNVLNVEATDPNLINSSRRWIFFTDQDFSGAVSISAPFNWLGQAQILSGGILIQHLNRNFHSDLLFMQGKGYYPLTSLIDRERYFPGGLSVTGYHVNNPGSRNVYANQLGNYTGSDNTGSAYIRMEARFTSKLFADLGLRMESSSQLVSNSQYNFIAGFRNAQLTPLDENVNTVRFDMLPSINIRYAILKTLRVHAAWFMTLKKPLIQQLTKYREYDAGASMISMGNPLLHFSSINNFDAGLQWLAGHSLEVNVSGFYKHIVQPLEKVLTSYTPGTLMNVITNTPDARSTGITGDVRLHAGRRFSNQNTPLITFVASGALIRSNVKAGPVQSFFTSSVREHTLSGSPSHTANASLIIYPARFTQFTVLYNRTGDYITAVGSGKEHTIKETGKKYLDIPDYRAKARQELDVQLSQKIFKQRLQLSAGIIDLLAENYIEYQDLNGNKKMDAPIVVSNSERSGGYYQSGIDNTVLNIKTYATYYFTISYLFK